MVYPVITDNFELDVWNANFLELYNQMNVMQSYTPTASNLGTITTHTAMVKSGIGRYKLQAVSGNWAQSTVYILCTLTQNYRPTVEIKKEIYMPGRQLVSFTIYPNGNVSAYPRDAMNGVTVTIDETYVI